MTTTIPAVSTVTLANAGMIREFLEYQQRRNRTADTLTCYHDCLSKFLGWMGDTPLAAASVAKLEGFVDRPRVRRRPDHPPGARVMGPPATRRRDVTIIRSLYKYLGERGRIGVNPALLLIAPTVAN